MFRLNQVHIMANVYVYSAVAIAPGISPNCRMRAVNYNHVLCFWHMK